MRLLPSLFCVFALGCAAPDEVAFSSVEGSAAGLGLCLCTYDDGSHGDLTLQLTCTGGTSAVSTMSLFLDPRAAGAEQGVTIIFQTDRVVGSFGGGGKGQFTKLGKPRRANASKIVRDLDGVELRWDTQTSCDLAYGCESGPIELPAGALRGGGGGCKDFWASVDQL